MATRILKPTETRITIPSDFHYGISIHDWVVIGKNFYSIQSIKKIDSRLLELRIIHQGEYYAQP